MLSPTKEVSVRSPFPFYRRTEIVELFSTYLSWDMGRPAGWIADAQLQSSIEQSLGRLAQADASRRFWVLYWHRIWQDDQTVGAEARRLAARHLCAYLQEACYRAARRASTRFTSTRFEVFDLFQIGMLKCDRVLRGFQPERGDSLDNYAISVFHSIIGEALRQHQEADISSPWALLRRVTQRFLSASLGQVPYDARTIRCYVLAWICFRELYCPAPRRDSARLADPDSATWQSVCALYHRESFGQGLAAGPPPTPQLLEQWLRQCAVAVRAALVPDVRSLGGAPGDSTALDRLETLPVVQQPSEFERLIAEEQEQEREALHERLNALLGEAIIQVQAQADRDLLQLYYQSGMTQSEIGERFGIRQWTVHRRLKRLKAQLLEQLAPRCAQVLHRPLSLALLEAIGTVLEEWLQAYHGDRCE